MDKFQHSACNAVLGAPPNTPIDVCGALPIFRTRYDAETPVVFSFWKPDAAELKALNEGRAVSVCLWGHTHAPLLVQVAAFD